MAGAGEGRREIDLKRTKSENRDDEAGKKDGEKATATMFSKTAKCKKTRRRRRRPLFQFPRLLAAASQSSSSFERELPGYKRSLLRARAVPIFLLFSLSLSYFLLSSLVDSPRPSVRFSADGRSLDSLSASLALSDGASRYSRPRKAIKI